MNDQPNIGFNKIATTDITIKDDNKTNTTRKSINRNPNVSPLSWHFKHSFTLMLYELARFCMNGILVIKSGVTEAYNAAINKGETVIKLISIINALY